MATLKLPLLAVEAFKRKKVIKRPIEVKEKPEKPPKEQPKKKPKDFATGAFDANKNPHWREL